MNPIEHVHDHIPPNMNQCDKCGRRYNHLTIRAEAFAAVRFTSGIAPDTVYSLCLVCTFALGEFFEPQLKENEEWNEMRDRAQRVAGSALN